MCIYSAPREKTYGSSSVHACDERGALTRWYKEKYYVNQENLMNLKWIIKYKNFNLDVKKCSYCILLSRVESSCYLVLKFQRYAYLLKWYIQCFKVIQLSSNFFQKSSTVVIKTEL